KTGGGTVTLGPYFTGQWANVLNINAGTLALVGTTTIASTTNIAVASGAMLDASGLSATFTLGAAQTLSGSGTVNGNITLASGAKLQPGRDSLKLSITGNLTVNNNDITVDAGGGTIPVRLYPST